MSYYNKIWEIIPKHSFLIRRNCPKCGNHSSYAGTGNFRVNANGNSLDVWLIYQCEKCKSTYNLTIYERISPGKITGKEYEKFLENNSSLALQYGTDRTVFQRNKAEILTEEMELIIRETEGEKNPKETYEWIRIENPHELKLRVDKVIAAKFEVSKTRVKKWIEEGSITGEAGEELQKASVGKNIKIKMKKSLWDS